MNAVGIDVSKGKSMVAIIRPLGEIVAHLSRSNTRLVTLSLLLILSDRKSVV